jgi:hypothetical protein
MPLPTHKEIEDAVYRVHCVRQRLKFAGNPELSFPLYYRDPPLDYKWVFDFLLRPLVAAGDLLNVQDDLERLL